MVAEHEGSVLVRWRHVVVASFVGSPQPVVVLRARDELRSGFEATGRKQLWLGYFEARAITTDTRRVEQIRTSFLSLLRDTRGQLDASANVIGGEGFSAAALRAAGSAIAALVRSPQPLRTFGRLSEGARFLSTFVPPTESRDFERELLSAAEDAVRRSARSVR